MDKTQSYEHFKGLYLTGNLKAFRSKYKTLKAPADEIKILAIKVFKEANAWSELFSVVKELKDSKEDIYRIKGGLYAAFFSFLLDIQSRKNAQQVMLACDQVSWDYLDSELDYFAQRISLSTQMALLVLGLGDADGKDQIIETGLDLFQKYQHINEEEGFILLESLIGHSLSSPKPNPRLALQILDKHAKIPSNEVNTEISVAPFYLQFARAKLESDYFNREHLKSPDVLPHLLLSIKESFEKIGYTAGKALLYSLYGKHLLQLEYLEGILWLENSIIPLWELGFEHLAFENKKQIINWTEQRGFIAEAEQFSDKYGLISRTELAPFQIKINQLYDAHRLFAEGQYSSSKELLESANLSEESETFKVSFTSLLVNSAGKLQANHQQLENLLDEQLQALKSIKNSILLAQLYLFKALIQSDTHLISYKTAIELFEKLGFKDEVVNHLINYSYDIVQRRHFSKQRPLIDEEVISGFKRASEILEGAEWIVNRKSLTGTLYQRWGIVQMLAELIEEASRSFQLAGEYFLQANSLVDYALNVNHVTSTYIKLGRDLKNIDYYNAAVQALEEPIKLLEKTSLIDFSWRLNFNMALALSEPLKYGLVGKDVEYRERFSKAKDYYHRTLEIFSLILKRNNLTNTSQKLLAYGHLNKEIRQLIFSGFYFFYFESNWEDCIFWLERVRAKTLLAAIADKISPNQGIKNHELIHKEVILKEKIISASNTLQKKELKESLELLYQAMYHDDKLKIYSAKKQEHVPDYPTIQHGIQSEEKLSGRKIFFIYFYAFSDEIYVFGIRSAGATPLYAKLSGLSALKLEKELRVSYALLLRSYHLAKPSESFWLKYSSIISPIEEWTSSGDIICIIPYGFLHDLPYHALQINGQPLIARNPIFYNSSLSSWEYLRQQVNQLPLLKNPVVLANPESNLQQSLLEADFIGALLKIRPLKESQVTRHQFLTSLADSSLLHFAGHGFYDNSQGIESGVRLHSGDIVTVEEIMNQNINADLVVLSACDTGLHRNHPGEERAGLVTAFLSSGAKSVIANLWSVTDIDAKNFYSIFYPKLISGIPKVIALQETMLELMKDEKRKQFYHWGAFSLHGYWM